MTNPSRFDIITALSTQEETIASLYAAFSVALPELEAFWSNLVIQEKAHGEVLKQLAELCESEDVYFNPSKFNVDAIQTNIEHIKKEIAKVSAQGITPICAFSLAVDIEHSLIEAGYFQVIETNISHIKKELEAIERHTKQHIKLVEDGLNKAKDNNDQVVEL